MRNRRLSTVLGRWRFRSLPGQGEDPQIALGVTVAPERRPGASPTAPDGDDARDDRDDRKALNLAKEALKKAERGEATIAELREINRQLLERIPSSQPNGKPAEPAKAPYTPDELTAFAKAEDWQSYTEAMEDNAKWYREQALQDARQTARQEVGTVTKQDRLKAYLISELGLTGLPESERQLLLDEKRKLIQEFALDDATAEVVARGVVNQRFRRGEVELTDLRDAAKKLTDTPDTTTPETTAPPKIEVDWHAPNRGLPAEMVDSFRRWKLEKVLTKSPDPRVEEEYRSIVLDILRDEHGRRRQ